MSWQPKDKPSERESFVSNMQRAELSGPMPYTVTCGQEGCNTTHKIVESYQCFFCKIFFCEHCAEQHFRKEEHATG